MNLVVFNSSDDILKHKIQDFEDKYDLSYINKYKKNKKKNDQNSIVELVLNISKETVLNACYYEGTKDNRLVQLSITNDKENSKKVNKEFLDEATKHAFERLNAKTVVIFSKKENSLYEEYESLGLLNDQYIYLKDKEDYKEMRAVK